MKKISIFLCTIICILLLGGCGRQQNETTYIGADKAKQLALDACGITSSDAESVTTDLVTRDGQDCYQIDITTAGQNYQLSVDAVTGNIVSINIPVAAQGNVSNEVNTGENTTTNETSSNESTTANTTTTDENTTTNESTNSSNTAANEKITVNAAKANALAHAGLTSEQVTFTESKLDYDDGRQVYELEFYSGNNEYDYEIDAYTGEVVSYDCEADGYVDCYALPLPSSSGTAITADEAKELALAQVPGATTSDIKEFKTDYDDGRTEYEGKIIYDRVEYEFEIDSVGNILSWEEEPLHSTMQPK
ncbi:MAG: PepSY domain-containing protein [Clostridiales bacterium]|nr:PepSY domain-containing protein [Clostridiales bacterium]